MTMLRIDEWVINLDNVTAIDTNHYNYTYQVGGVAVYFNAPSAALHTTVTYPDPSKVESGQTRSLGRTTWQPDPIGAGHPSGPPPAPPAAPAVEEHEGHVKTLIFYGETADRLRDWLAQNTTVV
jgi:hypothetical protein